jgi:hypothetical protein
MRFSKNIFPENNKGENMSLQTTVNATQGFGVVGSFYDDSPRRVNPMTITAGTPVAAVQATGTITNSTAVPATGDTVTIGGRAYTLKATLAAAYDVKIGATIAATMASLQKAINGTGVEGTDYFAGTLANLSVTSGAPASGVITLTAIYGGVSGNSILLAKSGTNLAVSDANLTGGVDAYANSATVGRAFSYDSSDKSLAVQGGAGEFAGVLVNPKHYTFAGLDATLVVENGKTGELCTMGHIVIKPANSAVVGYSAYRDDSTGAISAYTGTGSQSGKTLIPGSKFILVDSTSPNGLAVLQLG